MLAQWRLVDSCNTYKVRLKAILRSDAQGDLTFLENNVRMYLYLCVTEKPVLLV